MRAQLLAGLRAVVVLTILCGLAFPLFVTLVAQVAFNDKADGSLIERDGKVVGSSLIGQSFTTAEYFHGRPSAAGAPHRARTSTCSTRTVSRRARPFRRIRRTSRVVASSASNFGPTNPEFLATVAERVQAYREENGLDENQRVPVDAVTASGSGLDPQISIANARLQAPRVAEERDLSVDEVNDLIDDHTQGRSLGFLGEKGVNVLELNLALDREVAQDGRSGAKRALRPPPRAVRKVQRWIWKKDDSRGRWGWRSARSGPSSSPVHSSVSATRSRTPTSRCCSFSSSFSPQ